MTWDSMQLYTVSELNEAIQSLLDSDQRFLSVCVKGELSNYKVYPSGHHYFTLKDQESSLRCVMFRSHASRLHFRPENGLQVSAVGRVQVFLRDGCYQLYCTDLIPDGVGDLQLAFEQLKNRLYQEGLFELSAKKSLPIFPERIVLITSPVGAAVQDMIRILRTRWPLANIMVYPVRVQGKEAPSEISEAISKVNEWRCADCIITGRGGGSLEDLWAFNEECVARAIYASQIPVISAVGHEPDVTISDFVADQRASTPSNAAEIAVPDQRKIREQIDALTARLCHAENRLLQQKKLKLEHYQTSTVLHEISYYTDLRRMEIDRLSDLLNGSVQKILSERYSALSSVSASLNAMNPLNVLSRGYLFAENDQHTVLRSVLQVTDGEHINLQFADGRARCVVEDREVREFGK